MIPVKTQPRFKCDFCKKRSVKAAMEKHEKICFRNPNRYCEVCDNTGVIEDNVEHYTFEVPCPYCSREDKDKTAAIDKYYEQQNKPPEPEITDNLEVPF